jgi:periplasmic protein TonB
MKYNLLLLLILLFISQSAISQTATGDSIRKDYVFVRTGIEPSYPGGAGAWTKYIKKQIEQNIDALVDDNKSGTCRVRFIVDKEGNVSNAEVLTMKGSALAKVATNAIVKGPKWIPAMQNGRTVTAYKEQPLTFTIEGK